MAYPGLCVSPPPPPPPAAGRAWGRRAVGVWRAVSSLGEASVCERGVAPMRPAARRLEGVARERMLPSSLSSSSSDWGVGAELGRRCEGFLRSNRPKPSIVWGGAASLSAQ